MHGSKKPPDWRDAIGKGPRVAQSQIRIEGTMFLVVVTHGHFPHINAVKRRRDWIVIFSVNLRNRQYSFNRYICCRKKETCHIFLEQILFNNNINHYQPQRSQVKQQDHHFHLAHFPFFGPFAFSNFQNSLPLTRKTSAEDKSPEQYTP